MTTKVTKESLAENIGRLEEHQRICREYNAELSINQEYQLKAYRLLVVYMESCSHDWVKGRDGVFRCDKCGDSW